LPAMADVHDQAGSELERSHAEALRELEEWLGHRRKPSILPPKLAELVATRGGVFTAAEARHRGFGPEMLRSAVASGAVVRVVRGVYTDRTTYSEASGSAGTAYDLRAAAAVARLRRTCLVSHESAAMVSDP
jgi:Transcriptional regulator, AbiEi antitoxin